MLDENQQVRFTQLWTDALPNVSQFVGSLVRDSWAVADIVQNTSLTLLRKFSEYDETKPFLAWAIGVAKFEILVYKRDFSRDRIVFDSEFLDHYAQVWSEVAPRVGHESAALRDCIDKLDGRLRMIVKLRYAEGETSEAIATKLNLTAANVRTILMRTREILQRCVGHQVGLQGESA